MQAHTSLYRSLGLQSGASAALMAIAAIEGSAFLPKLWILCTGVLAAAVLFALSSYYTNIENQESFTSESDHRHDEEFYRRIGFDETMINDANEAEAKETRIWNDYLKKYDLQADQVDRREAGKSFLVSFLYFLPGCVLPLSVLFMKLEPHNGKIAGIICLIIIVLASILKSRAVGQPKIYLILAALSLNVVAAAAVFFIAKGFSNGAF